MLDNWAAAATDIGGSWRDHRWTVSDYAAAYRRGLVNPTEVVTSILKSIVAAEENDPPLRAVVMTNEGQALDDARAVSAQPKGFPRATPELFESLSLHFYGIDCLFSLPFVR